MLTTLVVSAYMTLTLLIYGRTQRTYPGYWHWVGGNIFLLCNYLFLTLRGTIPDFLSIAVANSVGVVGLILHLGAVQRFVAKASRIGPYFLLPLIVFAGHSYWVGSHDDIIIRNSIFTICAVAILLPTATTLLFCTPSGPRALYIAFAGTLLACLVALILRAIIWIELPGPRILFVNSPGNAISLLALLLFDISWTLFFILLHNQRMNSEIAALTDELNRQASYDALTGVYSRRRFEQIGNSALGEARYHRQPLSLLIFDLDWFKEINDRFGHATGDEALRKVAQVCQSHLRPSDDIGRLGGDEFLILLPGTTIEQANEAGRRLQAAVRAIPFEHGSSPLGLSFGAAQLREHDSSLDSLIQRADARLYAMKRQRPVKLRVL